MTERIDCIGGGLKVIQRTNLFAFGTDAVLLGKFAGLRNNDRVIDLGTGTGIIPFMLMQRRKPKQVVALEIQEVFVDLCRRSVRLNQLESMITVVHGDIRNVRALFPAESFDLATCNPPYMQLTGSQLNVDESWSIARHELDCRLEDVAAAFAWLVRFGGKAALVHRPQRLGDIFCSLRSFGLEPKRLQLVYPQPDREASIALVEAEKGAKPGLKILPPHILKER